MLLNRKYMSIQKYYEGINRGRRRCKGRFPSQSLSSSINISELNETEIGQAIEF